MSQNNPPGKPDVPKGPPSETPGKGQPLDPPRRGPHEPPKPPKDRPVG